MGEQRMSKVCVRSRVCAREIGERRKKRERERESVCVCVWERERQRKREIERKRGTHHMPTKSETFRTSTLVQTSTSAYIPVLVHASIHTSISTEW